MPNVAPPSSKTAHGPYNFVRGMMEWVRLARRGGKMRALASLRPPHEKIQVCLLDAIRLRHALSYYACAVRGAAGKV